jgi:hypothetical protein
MTHPSVAAMKAKFAPLLCLCQQITWAVHNKKAGTFISNCIPMISKDNIATVSHISIG